MMLEDRGPTTTRFMESFARRLLGWHLGPNSCGSVASSRSKRKILLRLLHMKLKRTRKKIIVPVHQSPSPQGTWREFHEVTMTRATPPPLTHAGAAASGKVTCLVSLSLFASFNVQCHTSEQVFSERKRPSAATSL